MKRWKRYSVNSYNSGETVRRQFPTFEFLESHQSRSQGKCISGFILSDGFNFFRLNGRAFLFGVLLLSFACSRKRHWVNVESEHKRWVCLQVSNSTVIALSLIIRHLAEIIWFRQLSSTSKVALWIFPLPPLLFPPQLNELYNYLSFEKCAGFCVLEADLNKTSINLWRGRCTPPTC